MVKAAVRVSSGVPPFLFPFGLSARRRAERFGRWGHPESLLEQADWGGVAGAGVRAGGAKTGSRSRSLGGPPRGGRGFGAAGFSPAVTLIEMAVMHFIAPAVLTLVFSELLRKKGWIREGDMALKV